jgi:hypothetical protein
MKSLFRAWNILILCAQWSRHSKFGERGCKLKLLRFLIDSLHSSSICSGLDHLKFHALLLLLLLLNLSLTESDCDVSILIYCPTLYEIWRLNNNILIVY